MVISKIFIHSIVFWGQPLNFGFQVFLSFINLTFITVLLLQSYDFSLHKTFLRFILIESSFILFNFSSNFLKIPVFYIYFVSSLLKTLFIFIDFFCLFLWNVSIWSYFLIFSSEVVDLRWHFLRFFEFFCSNLSLLISILLFEIFYISS